jgi:predicted HTH transcriptional regulator
MIPLKLETLPEERVAEQDCVEYRRRGEAIAHRYRNRRIGVEAVSSTQVKIPISADNEPISTNRVSIGADKEPIGADKETTSDDRVLIGADRVLIERANAILEYIDKHGSIANSGAQKLLGLKASGVRKAFKPLIQAGLIEPVGEKRHRVYRRAEYNQLLSGNEL